MDLEKVKIFIKDQFPEFYRDEFPQFVDFVTKYYEYISTTNYSLMDTVRDIDSSLDEYVSILKKNFAINIPEFGKLSDRDFLLFAKQFYTSRGSQDSYRFLFRAMYGKEVDILYPGESVLKPSDGIWNQEVSIRVQSSPVSHTFETGNIVTLSALDLAGKTFIFEAQDGSKSRIDCIRVNQVAINIYDIFISRSYSGKIEQNDTFNYTVRFEDILDNQTVVKNLTLTGTVVPIPSKIKIYDYGQGYTAGTLYTLPAVLPLRFRIKKIDESNNNRVVYTEIIQPGYTTGSQFNQYYIVDSADKNFLQSNPTYYSSQTYCTGDYFSETDLEQYVRGDEFVPTSTQTLFKVEFAPTLTYPGLYTSSKGFLSDAIKLHDSNYYQSFSYVIRLDEQLETYKTLVKRLLHPAGMSLWAEYNISNTIDVRATIANIIELLKLFVEDDVFATDFTSLDYILSREDTVLNPAYAFNYFADSGVNAYTEEEDKVTFDITNVREDFIEQQLDNGMLYITEQRQTYSSEDYFAEIGVWSYVGLDYIAPQPQDYVRDNYDYFAEIDQNAYCVGELSGTRILYPGITRPTNDQSGIVESGQLVIKFEEIYALDYFAETGVNSYSIGTEEQIRILHDGILRPTGDSVGVFDDFPSFATIMPQGDSVAQSEMLEFSVGVSLAELTETIESGQLLISGTQSQIFPIHNGILRPTDDFIDQTAENGYIELVPLTSSDQDYCEPTYFAEDYCRGGVEYRTIHNGILRPENDSTILNESGKIIIQSYTSQDIYANDYVDQDNDQTYAYGNESNIRQLYDGILRPENDLVNIIDILSINSSVNKEENVSINDLISLDIETPNSDTLTTEEDVIFETGVLNEDTLTTIENILFDVIFAKEDTSKALESGYLEFVPGVVSDQDYCEPTYFAEDYCRGGVEYTSIFNGIVAIPKDEFTITDSGRIIVQSYTSQDIYANDYVDQDNDQTYAYGNEDVFREIFSGIVNIPKDEFTITDSGRIIVQSYTSQDIYANDYVDQDNDQTYAYGNETNVTMF